MGISPYKWPPVTVLWESPRVTNPTAFRDEHSASKAPAWLLARAQATAFLERLHAPEHPKTINQDLPTFDVSPM